MNPDFRSVLTHGQNAWTFCIRGVDGQRARLGIQIKGQHDRE